MQEKRLSQSNLQMMIIESRNQVELQQSNKPTANSQPNDLQLFLSLITSNAQNIFTAVKAKVQQSKQLKAKMQQQQHQHQAKIQQQSNVLLQIEQSIKTKQQILTKSQLKIFQLSTIIKSKQQQITNLTKTQQQIEKCLLTNLKSTIYQVQQQTQLKQLLQQKIEQIKKLLIQKNELNNKVICLSTVQKQKITLDKKCKQMQNLIISLSIQLTEANNIVNKMKQEQKNNIITQPQKSNAKKNNQKLIVELNEENAKLNHDNQILTKFKIELNYLQKQSLKLSNFIIIIYQAMIKINSFYQSKVTQQYCNTQIHKTIIQSVNKGNLLKEQQCQQVLNFSVKTIKILQTLIRVNQQNSKQQVEFYENQIKQFISKIDNLTKQKDIKKALNQFVKQTKKLSKEQQLNKNIIDKVNSYFDQFIIKVIQFIKNQQLLSSKLINQVYVERQIQKNRIKQQIKDLKKKYENNIENQILMGDYRIINLNKQLLQIKKIKQFYETKLFQIDQYMTTITKEDKKQLLAKHEAILNTNKQMQKNTSLEVVYNQQDKVEQFITDKSISSISSTIDNHGQNHQEMKSSTNLTNITNSNIMRINQIIQEIRSDIVIEEFQNQDNLQNKQKLLYQHQIKELKIKYETQASAQLKTKDSLINNLKVQIQNLKLQLKTKENLIKQHSTRIQKLTQDLKKQQRQRTQSSFDATKRQKAQREKLQGQKQKLNQRIDDLTFKLESAESKITKLQKQISESKASHGKSSDSLTAARNQITSLQQKLEEKQSQLKISASQLEKQKRNKQTQNTHIEQCLKQKQNLAKIIQTLQQQQKKLIELRNKNIQTQTIIKERQIKMQQLNQIKNQIIQSIQQAINSNMKQTISIIKLKQQVENLHKQLTIKKQLQSALKQQLQSNKVIIKYYQQANQLKSQKIKSLQQQLKLKSKILDLQKLYQQQKKQLQKLQYQYQQQFRKKQSQNKIQVLHQKFQECYSFQNGDFSQMYIKLKIKYDDFISWQTNLEQYNKINKQCILYPLYLTIQGDNESPKNQNYIKINYQQFIYTLNNEQIQRRNSLNQRYKENQLWYLLYVLVSAANEFSLINKKIGDIRPQNIFISQKGYVKLGTCLSWPNSQTNLQRTINKHQITYVSPQQLKLCKKNKIQQSTINKVIAESFSIGLTMLHVGLLEDLSQIYDLSNYEINEKLLEQKIQTWMGLQMYSSSLKQIVKNLCILDYEKRQKYTQIFILLHPHAQTIYNIEPFVIIQEYKQAPSIKVNQQTVGIQFHNKSKMIEARLIDGLTGELIGGQPALYEALQQSSTYQTGTNLYTTGYPIQYTTGNANQSIYVQQAPQVVNTGKQVIKGELLINADQLINQNQKTQDNILTNKQQEQIKSTQLKQIPNKQNQNNKIQSIQNQIIIGQQDISQWASQFQQISNQNQNQNKQTQSSQINQKITQKYEQLKQTSQNALQEKIESQL